MGHLRSIILFLFAASVFPRESHAIFNVTSTSIKEGVLAVESRNRFDHDDSAGKDGYRAHVLKFDYGITGRWQLELSGKWEDIPQEGFGYSSTEIESKHRFFDPGDYWLDFSLELAYETAHATAAADEAKVKLQAQKEFGNWNHVINSNFSKQVGSNASEDTRFSLSWRSLYHISPYLKPSLQYFGSFGEISDMQGYNEQKHLLGPVFYGDLVPGVEYKVGYLFGISDAAEDGSFMFFLSHEFLL